MAYNNIPQEMRLANRWVCWRRERRKSKFSNVPKTVTGRPASHSNEKTWTSFKKAVSAKKLHKFDGISFALGDGFIGIDFDNVYDPQKDKWHGPSKKIIDYLIDRNSYVEFSPSKKGVHAILWVENIDKDKELQELKSIISMAKTGFKKEFKDKSGAAIEFYHTNRILTTTGNKIHNCNPDFSNGKHRDVVKDIFQEVIDLFKLKKRKKKVIESESVLTDQQVIEIAFKASNGQKFQDLFNGNWQEYGPTQSNADMSFLNSLAFYTGRNKEQMKRLFRQSGLFRPEKGEYYIDLSVDNAIEYCNEVYKPKKELQVKAKIKPKEIMKDNQRKELPNVYVSTMTEDETIEPRKSNEVASDIMKLIEKQDPNELKIFVKDGKLGRIKYSTRTKRFSEDHTKEVTSSIFEEFTEKEIRGYLNRLANFYKLTKKEDMINEMLLADPPTQVGVDIISNQNTDNIPYLVQIINHPIVTKDWQIINEPGYHKDSQIYLEPSKLVTIQNMSVEKAYDILTDWLSDFPFKDHADVCNTLALLITMLIRPALPEGELPPLFIITSNVQGSGKSTLSQILSAVIIGEAAGSTQLPNNEEEIRKAIGAELILGTEVVVLDNITEQVMVASSSLASAISEPTIRFRLLGKSKMIHADNTATYILTGNNVDANADLTDRACFIRLDSDVRAAERKFKTESILADTIKNRERLFSAVHTIVQTWIDEGKKRGSATHRSNVWAKCLSGMFDMLDQRIDYESEDDEGRIIRPLKEFLNNDREARIKANPEFEDWVSFRNDVLAEFGEESWTVADILHLGSFRTDHEADDENYLGTWFKNGNDYHESNRRQALGIYIRANVDKPIGPNWKLISTGKKGNKNSYAFKDLRENNEIV